MSGGTFSVEDAKFVSECRVKMVVNMQNGLVPEAGLDKEQLKRALEIVRKERSLGLAGAGKVTKRKAAPMIPIDLNEFMKS